MRKISKPLLGAKPPLFDRIKDVSDAGYYKRLLSKDELRESIQSEISTMIQSRVAIRKSMYDGETATMAVYGAPEFSGLVDFSYFDAQNETEWPEIALYLKTAIEIVEPRIKNVSVKIMEFDKLQQELLVNLMAEIAIPGSEQEISFPLALASDRK